MNLDREQVLDIHTLNMCGLQLVRTREAFDDYCGNVFMQGGWWTRPSNWRMNTAILFGGILAVTYGAWSLSAAKEVSSTVIMPTPSQVVKIAVEIH